MKIMLVEDNEYSIKITKEMANDALNECHAELVVAKDGQDAIDKFKSSKDGEYGLIIMDMIMPRIKGSEAVSRIRHMRRKDAKSVPIVFLSAIGEDMAKKMMDIQMINGYITKPIDNRRLNNMLHYFTN